MRTAFLLCLVLSSLAAVSGDDRTIGGAGRISTLPHPLVIAHRGASGYLPEHTTESAAYAHALGADYIEQDVVLSKDAVAVVLHDVTLEDVTNVSDVYPDRRRSDGHWYVFDFTLSELRRLNLVERWGGDSSQRFPRGSGTFQVATLKEHIELIQGLDRSRGTATGLYIEIKDPARHHEEQLDVSRAVLSVLGEFGFHAPEDRVFLQCFDPVELKRLRTELHCRMPLIQLLEKTPTPDEVRQHAKVVDGLGVSLACVVTGKEQGDSGRAVLTDVVTQAHENSLLVHAWTFRTDDLPEFADNTDQLLKWLVLDAGVDGIFADQPDAVIRWRSKLVPEARKTFRFIQE